MVWESTGLYGESSLRRYQLGAHQVEHRVPLSGELFGEGICRVGADIWQLTWQDRIALRWDAWSSSWSTRSATTARAGACARPTATS